MRGVTAALDKAREQISDATWREGLALEKARSQAQRRRLLEQHHTSFSSVCVASRQTSGFSLSCNSQMFVEKVRSQSSKTPASGAAS